MTESVFTSMSSEKMATLIGFASERVTVAIPAIRRNVALTLIAASSRLGAEQVTIVLDCDEEVFRLGYGDFDAVQTLRAHGIKIRQCSGLRVGVLVCDSRAWIFTPTALYVQQEVHSDETPNAVQLTDRDIERLIDSIVPAESGDKGPESVETAVEIGHERLSERQMMETGKSLEIAPPVAFDIARQVRVFQPYIQYVDVSLTGCALQNKRVKIPKSVQKLRNKEIEDRLKTTFDLIEKNCSISSKKLDDELDQIRDNLTKSLGKPWGRVMLKSARATFDDRIKALRERVEQHKQRVQSELEEYLERSKNQVVEYYLPLFEKEPPDVLIGQLLYSTPTREDIQCWLRRELDREFPGTEELISEMRLDVQFRDVTYETLCEDGFFDALREAYPLVPWDKPFEEFTAAQERE